MFCSVLQTVIRIQTSCLTYMLLKCIQVHFKELPTQSIGILSVANDRNQSKTNLITRAMYWFITLKIPLVVQFQILRNPRTQPALQFAIALANTLSISFFLHFSNLLSSVSNVLSYYKQAFSWGHIFHSHIIPTPRDQFPYQLWQICLLYKSIS